MTVKCMRKKVKVLCIYMFMALMSILSIGPFIYVFLTALKTQEQIYDPSQIIPTYINFENFSKVLFHSNFSRYFFNSFLVAAVTTGICVILSVMASYALSRYEIIGADKIKMVILMTRMFPGVLLCIPFYIIMKQLELIDTYTGLIMLYCSFTLPFAIWRTNALFSGIPWELEEAARIDGCSRLSAFLHVIIPVARPGLFVNMLFCFMSAWEEYMYASIFINTPLKKTIQVGMKDFVGQYTIEWGLLMSAVTLSLIPVILFFAVVQKNLVGGLAEGSVKG